MHIKLYKCQNKLTPCTLHLARFIYSNMNNNAYQGQSGTGSAEGERLKQAGALSTDVGLKNEQVSKLYEKYVLCESVAVLVMGVVRYHN